MAQRVSGGFFSWIGAVRCITCLSPYPPQKLSSDACFYLLEPQFGLLCHYFDFPRVFSGGWVGGFVGGKTDDNTFAWQRLLKCQADDCTRILSVSVSIVKAFK